MGIDAGFDMVPRLSKGMLDRQKWDAFIATVKTRYKDDKLVEVKPNYIEFHAGEHPRLPFEGHKLLRFSSNISGSHAEGVYEYILAVTQIAESAFGTRVQRWDESVDRWGIYGWQEVKGSFKTYEQVSPRTYCLVCEKFLKKFIYSPTSLKFRIASPNPSP